MLFAAPTMRNPIRTITDRVVASELSLRSLAAAPALAREVARLRAALQDIVGRIEFGHDPSVTLRAARAALAEGRVQS